MIQGWYWVEILTGLAVNVVLLISGIGLLKYKGWARSLGIWTALFKILRLGLLYGFFIIVVVPPFSKAVGEAVGQMMVQQQQIMGGKGAPAMADPQMFTKIYAIMYSFMGVGMIAIGSIFPGIMLYFLTRPRIQSACDPSHKPVTGTDEL